MGADLVVVGGVCFEDAAQMRLTEHNDVVQAFAPDRSDEPLDMSVLPGRVRRNWMITDAHGANASGVGCPERAVAITNQITWSFVPREGFGHLTRDPFRRRIAGDSDP